MPLNLSENFRCEDRKCKCCGKPESEWVELTNLQRDYPVCEVCQRCYETMNWAQHSVPYLETIIRYIKNDPTVT